LSERALSVTERCDAYNHRNQNSLAHFPHPS
jgi:hypothetical protein